MRPSKDKDCQRYVDDPSYVWFGGHWCKIGTAERLRLKEQERQRAIRHSPGPCASRGCEKPRQQFSTGAYGSQCTAHLKEARRKYNKTRHSLTLSSIYRTNKTIAKYQALLNRPPHQEAT